MGLANAAVVWSGRLAKCIEVDAGEARLVWIDSRDRLVERRVPASEVVKFAEASRPRSFWPEANMGFDGDLEEQDARLARRNRARLVS